jgi:hypothetical protein
MGVNPRACLEIHQNSGVFLRRAGLPWSPERRCRFRGAHSRTRNSFGSATRGPLGLRPRPASFASEIPGPRLAAATPCVSTHDLIRRRMDLHGSRPDLTTDGGRPEAIDSTHRLGFLPSGRGKITRAFGPRAGFGGSSRLRALRPRLRNGRGGSAVGAYPEGESTGRGRRPRGPRGPSPEDMRHTAKEPPVRQPLKRRPRSSAAGTASRKSRPGPAAPRASPPRGSRPCASPGCGPRS